MPDFKDMSDSDITSIISTTIHNLRLDTEGITEINHRIDILIISICELIARLNTSQDELQKEVLIGEAVSNSWINKVLAIGNKNKELIKTDLELRKIADARARRECHEGCHQPFMKMTDDGTCTNCYSRRYCEFVGREAEEEKELS